MRLNPGTFLGVSLFMATTSVVHAQEASVRVQVSDSAGRPVDGTVTLTDAGRRVTRRCTTVAGRCTLAAPAGSYQATLAPLRGQAPPARPVSVPTTGSINLALRALDAPASTTTPRTGTTQTGSTSASSGGSPSTSGSTSSATASTSPSTSTASSARNLSSGRTLAAQGQITDSAGRPADATLTVKRGTQTVGTARSTAGRFSLYDLSAGSYTIQAAGVRGGTGGATVSIGSGVARPNIRLQ